MAIALASNFNVNLALPIDSRMVVQNDADLNNITNKYIGMVVFSNQSQTLYYLKTNNVWVPITSGAGAIIGNSGTIGTGNHTFYADSGVYFSGLKIVFDKSTEVIFEGNAYLNKINNQTSFGVYNYYNINYNRSLIDQLSGLPLGIRTGDIVNLFYKDINSNSLIYEPTVMTCFTGGNVTEDLIFIEHSYYENKALKKIKNLSELNFQFKENYSSYIFTGINNLETLDLSNVFQRNQVYNLSFEIHQNNLEYNIYLPNPSSGVLKSDRLLFNIEDIYNNTNLSFEEFELKIKNTNINFYTYTYTGNNGYDNTLSRIFVKNSIDFDNKIEFVFEERDWKLRSIFPEIPYEHFHEIYQINNLNEELERIDYTDVIDKKYTSSALSLNNFTNKNLEGFGDALAINDGGSVIILASTTGGYLNTRNKVSIFTSTEILEWKFHQELTGLSPFSRDFGRKIATNNDASILAISSIIFPTNREIVYIYTGKNTSIPGKFFVSEAGREPINGTYSIIENSNNITELGFPIIKQIYSGQQTLLRCLQINDDFIQWKISEAEIINNNVVEYDPDTYYYLDDDLEVSEIADKQWSISGPGGAPPPAPEFQPIYESWKISSTPFISGNNPMSNFGSDLAMNYDGSTLFVSALNNFSNNINSGAVFIYTGLNGNYIYNNIITDNTQYGFRNINFGRAISTNSYGDILFIGGDNNSGAGAVWVYTGIGNTWQFKQKITHPYNFGKIDFGYSLANNSDGSILFIGAPQFANGNGIVSIYSGNTNDGWLFLHDISGDGNFGTQKDYFGTSLDCNLDGSILFVGGTGDIVNLNTGAVWVYTGYNLDRWELSYKIKENNSKLFGKTLATDNEGSLLLVPDILNVNASGTGIVHAFANYPNTSIDSLDFKLRPTVNGVPVLLQGEVAGGGVGLDPFNGNRPIRRIPTIDTNYGGNTISGFLNNLFFPYTNATLSLNAFSVANYGYDTINSVTFAGQLDSKDDNITGIACLFSNTILSNPSTPIITNNTYSISPVNFLLSPPTPPSRQSTSSEDFKTRIFGIRSGVSFIQDSSSIRLRFAPPYFYGISNNINLGNEITGLTRVNPSTYLGIAGSNYNVGGRPSFINGIQFNFNQSTPNGYIYFAYLDYTNTPELISPWGQLASQGGIVDSVNNFDYTSTYTTFTTGINFPTRSNVTYRIYRSDFLTPVTLPTTLTLNFKFL